MACAQHAQSEINSNGHLKANIKIQTTEAEVSVTDV